MNSRICNLLVVAMAAALPLSLTAQTPTSSGSTTSGATKPSTTSSSAQSSQTGASSTRTPASSSQSQTRDATLSSSAGVSGAGSAGSIRRLNEDAVERQFTAKDLIGKEVYDRSGKRVGEVKDIVIASSTNPQLASGLSKRGNVVSTDATTKRSTTGATGTTTTRTASGSVGGAGASGSVKTGGESGIRASGTLGGTSAAGAAASHAQSMMGAMAENAVVISYGGFLGAGNSLLRVPLSQLNYDTSEERITINVTESELTSLPEATETSRSVAE